MARQLFQLLFAACAVGAAGYVVVDTPGVAAPPVDDRSLEDRYASPDANRPLSIEDSLPAAEQPAAPTAAAPTEDSAAQPAEPLAPVQAAPPRQTRMTPPPLARQPRREMAFDSRPRRTAPTAVRRTAFVVGEPQAAAAPALHTESHDAAPADSTSQTGISLSWIMPESANAGEDVRAALVLHNAGPAPAIDATVEAQLPPGLALVEAQPPADDRGASAHWSLGNLAAGASVRIDLILRAEGEGNLTPQAIVRTAQTAAAAIKLSRPQLAVRAAGEPTWQLGRPETVTFTVTNTGRSEATGVTIALRLPEGIDHSGGRELQYALGALAAGESRPIELVLTASQAGHFQVDAVVGVNAGSLAATACEFDVQSPRLDLTAAGPKLRYVDRPATYTSQVHNPGPAPAGNVRVALQVPAGMRFASASAGGSYDSATRTVNWFLGRLEVETTADVAVELVPTAEGDQALKVLATADAGAQAEARCVTQVQAISALDLELVEGDDPLEIGAETTHQIRVTNRGSKPATEIEVAVRLSAEAEAISATGPVEATTDNGDVVFESLAALAPGQVAVFEIRVRGAAAGPCRLTTYVRSAEQLEPAQAEAITTVYGE